MHEMQLRFSSGIYSPATELDDVIDDREAIAVAERLFKRHRKKDKDVVGYKVITKDAIGYRTIVNIKGSHERPTPSEDAVKAAYNSQPYNDLLYGDTSRPLNEEEVKIILKAAYAVDF
jgi:hypothetical protein